MGFLVCGTHCIYICIIFPQSKFTVKCVTVVTIFYLIAIVMTILITDMCFNAVYFPYRHYGYEMFHFRVNYVNHYALGSRGVYLYVGLI